MRQAPRGWASQRPPARKIGDQERFGVVGWVRAVEVTDGAHGWHVHVHAVVVRDHTLSLDDGHNAIHRLGARMWERWDRGLSARGFDSLRDSGGLDVRVARAAEKRLAEYLVKAGDAADCRWGVEVKARDMAREAVHGAAKKGRAGGRTPFEILDSTRHGEVRDLARWEEWVRVSAGRKQLTWSAGLRDLVGLSEKELTDAEIAEAEVGGEDVLKLAPDTWRAVRDHKAVRLLELLERDGLGRVMRWLDRRGLLYENIPGNGTSSG